MVKTFFVTLIITLTANGISAQNKEARLINWEFLSQVNFKDHYFKELEAWYLVPQFSKEVQKADNKQVIIKGYVIPLDVADGKYALSANPFSSCFFCGGSGPESVMTLQFAERPPRYKTDDVVRFTGTLILNKDDPDQFTYILKNAREL